MSDDIDWVKTFEDFPPAFHKLLSELMAEVAEEQKREAPRSTVRTDIRAIEDVVYPRRSLKPFNEALWDATQMSLSAVAKYSGVGLSHLHYLLSGERPLDRYKLERIAKAIHVDPAYFVEYRQMVLRDAIVARLTPHLSLRLYEAGKEALR